jgi:hypothetical protein
MLGFLAASAARAPEGRGRSAPPPGPGIEALVEAVARGEWAARGRLRAAGAAGREALWRALEDGTFRGREASGLRWWAEGGPPLAPTEVGRAVALALRTARPRESLAVLAQAAPRGLSEALASVLVREPDVEEDVVAVLEQLAARGVRREALDALLAGASAGRGLAAAAAVGLASPSGIDRLLVLLPPARFAEVPLARALADGRITLQAHVLRQAVAGHEGALAWAAAARLDGAVPLCLALAVGPDAARAEGALAQLEAIGSTDAWLAIARAVDGVAGEAARTRLTSLDAAAAAGLAERARRDVRDRPAALAALASGSAVGLAALERLAERPALAPEVLLALSAAPSAAASAGLLRLAARSDSPLPMLAALQRRLVAGDAEAGIALADLARRPGQRRAVLQALDAAGSAGAVFRALAQGADPRPAAVARPVPRRY